MNPLQLMDRPAAPVQAAPYRKPVARYTGEILLKTRPKIYRKAVELISQGESDNVISEICKISRHSLAAIREREAADIAQRKNELVMMLSNVAHISTGRAADTASKASFRDAMVGAGISVDKILALTGSTAPAVAVVVMPSDADRDERRALHDKLDAIAALLNE